MTGPSCIQRQMLLEKFDEILTVQESRRSQSLRTEQADARSNILK